MTRTLPERPSLDQYKRQAKELLKACRNGDAEARERLRARLPRLAAASDSEAARIALADAQRVIALEHGFPSWAKFKRRIEAVTSDAAEPLRPFSPYMHTYEDRTGGLLSLLRRADPAALDLLRKHHPRFADATAESVRAAEIEMDDARLVFARRHGFESWEELRGHVESIEPVAEGALARATQALNAGDVKQLGVSLRTDRGLVAARNKVGETLLHVAVAEGQHRAMRLLLDAGADPNAASREDWTPLHQAAYGHPPEPVPGPQKAALEAIELLLDAGADPACEAKGTGGTPLVQALFWGHNPLAERLAREAVVPHNLRVAAGLGRTDLLRELFDAGGGLRAEARTGRGFYRVHEGFPDWTPSDDPQEILDEALSYACRSARLEAAELLLERGADVNGVAYMCPALHWVARTNHVEVAAWLLERGADPNRLADFGGNRGHTALHQAVWAGRIDMLRWLATHGADLSVADETHESTPLGWAGFFHYDDIANALRQLDEGGEA